MAESILHFGAIRLRIAGTGILKPSLIGFDSLQVKSVARYTMSLLPGREPTILTNFTGQRARLKLFTDTLDDYMRVNRVIIYINQYGEEFPK